MHKFVQAYEDIQLGAEVSVNGIDYVCRVSGKENGFLSVEFEWWFDHSYPSRTERTRVPYIAYQCTYARTPDNISKDCGGDWTTVEQAYGINHLGSSDPDPVRNLAFRILKGEEGACNLAKNLLGINDDVTSRESHG